MVCDIVMSHASLSLYLAFLLITFNRCVVGKSKERKNISIGERGMYPRQHSRQGNILT
jgi:hypothetical protein